MGSVLADHNGNVRVVGLARQLAQQAQDTVRQAEWALRYGGGNGGGHWGGGYGDYNDQQALSQLRGFASYASQLAASASRIEPGSSGFEPGPRPHATSVRVGVLDHNDEEIGRQLVNIFRNCWHQADTVEYYLYSSWRLGRSQTRSVWDYQVCSTLRQLRQALGGVGPYAHRDAVRAANFDAMQLYRTQGRRGRRPRPGVRTAATHPGTSER
jgi:hypothetical protein